MPSAAVCVLGVGRAEEAGQLSTLGLRGHDDEIEIKENVVTWRAGGCTQKTYTLQPEAGHVVEVRSARGTVACRMRSSPRADGSCRRLTSPMAHVGVRTGRVVPILLLGAERVQVLALRAAVGAHHHFRK